MPCICKIVLLFGLFALGTWAQDKTSLWISIVDQNADFVAQAEVALKDGSGKIIKRLNTGKTQRIVIPLLSVGDYVLEIKSLGFKESTQKISLENGKNEFTVKLEIAEIEAEVTVEKDKIEKRLDEAFNTTLTQEQIDSLPENPGEIAEELKRRYGEDAIIRVDGFSGGTIPPKSQIASIRVTRSSFDAEFHEVGQTIIDISTRAGGGKLWFGTISSHFNHFGLNARNALSQNRLYSRTNTIFGIIIFPSVNNKTTFLTTFAGNNLSRTNIIRAQSPNTFISNQFKANTTFFDGDLTAIHNLSKTHTLRILYGVNLLSFGNSGVGGFNLPERAFSNNTLTNRIRLSESGPIKKTANQFRLEFINTNAETVPNNQTVAINVIGAFNGGGANINNSSSQQKLLLADINYFDHKKHAFKIGGEFEYVRNELNSADNLNGRFTFSSLNDFLANRPFSYTQRRTATTTNLSQIQLATFIQDDMRLLKNFQIGLGLRYEWQNNLNDSNNFSPRLSLTWSPDREARLVLRSGAGIFYHWFETNTLSTILSNDGRRGSDIIILNPSFPNPLLSGITSQTLAPSITQKADNLRNPYTFITKTGFNFRLNNKYNLEGFYTFRKGVHQFRSRDTNSPVNGIRANSQVGRIAQVESSGNSVENSLELKLEGKLKKGFSFDANYKIGKILSDFEDVFSLPVNNYDLSQERAVSNLDQRHRFNTRLMFPSWKSFSFNTTFRLESARPYTITTGRDDNGDSVINDRPTGFGRNSERGEWFKQVDANLTWRTKIGKEDDKNPLSKLKNQMIFTINVQNLFNQTNKQNFIGIQTSPFFRQAVSAAPSRTIQFGLSWIF